MTHRIEYEDLEVRIETGSEGLRVRLRSRDGNDLAPLRLPFSGAELTTLLATLEARIRGRKPTAEVDRHVVTGMPPGSGTDPETVGTELFRALFPGKLARLLARTLSRVEREPDRGLRIRLLFDPHEPGLAPVVALPWELLRNPDTGDFLARSHLTPVVRSLDVPRAAGRAPTSPPLRVLLVTAHPGHLPQLDLERERRAIETACEDPDWLEVDLLEHPDPTELRFRLQQGGHQVAHFMGHGDFDPDGGGRLLLADGDDVLPVPGKLLADAVHHLPDLRLVVLNACDTGQMPRWEGLDPFSGVATALVRAGLPAVVGMQFSISDTAAICFSKSFYRRLVAGFPLDAAVAEGRMDIHLTRSGGHEWATPTLYLRAPGGQLVDLSVVGSVDRGGSTRPPQAGGKTRRPADRTPRTRRLRALLLGLGALGGAALLAGLFTLLAPSGPGPEDPRSWLPGHLANPPGCPPPPGIDIPLIRIEPGIFRMGSETGEADEAPAHLVEVEQPFCLGLFEVTQAEWEAVMGEVGNPSRFRGPKRPVHRVPYDAEGGEDGAGDVQAFLEALNRRVDGTPFRLPTEAEWEYAARAGTTTDYSFGDDPAELPEHGNCLSSELPGDGFERVAPVGSFAPNPWGLYDVHGNVWEWVATPFGPYPGATPEGPPEEGRMVIRGGSFEAAPEHCRSADRNSAPPTARWQRIGFRLARDVAGTPAPAGR